MSKTVVDLEVEGLIARNVEVSFDFRGDGVTGLFGVLPTHKDKIRFLQVRHEEAVAFAACDPLTPSQCIKEDTFESSLVNATTEE